jgi:hypothetical protein
MKGENKVSCKNCTNRELGCHSICESYLEFRKTKDLEYESRKLRLDSIYVCKVKKHDRRRRK